MIKDFNTKNRMPIAYFWYLVTRMFLMFCLISTPFTFLGFGPAFFATTLIFIGLPMSLFLYLSYKNFSFILDAEKITIFSGIIFKESKTISFKNIQNVETSSGLISRIFGLTAIKIWTSSPSQIQVVEGNTINNPDIFFYVKTEDVELLKNSIYKTAS